MMGSGTRQLFLEQYAAIRHAEGRGSDDAAYYRSLPYVDLTGRNSEQWRIRARSFDHFVRKILVPLERRLPRPLDVLDLGAGNGWLTWRLGRRGHRVIALDIFMDEKDGLGATRKYAPLKAVAADFDNLPFIARAFDLAVFNASLHYSADYTRTLQEARRCLRSGGQVVIIDSPLYRNAGDGERMRRERQALFERTYGFRSEALGSIEYLDEPELARLSRELGIRWKRTNPWYGWKWAMRPYLAMLRRKRPPSSFFVIAGRFA